MMQTHITIDDLYNIVSLSDPRFSPDGQWLAYVRTEMDRKINGYKSAIWTMPARGEGKRRPAFHQRRQARQRSALVARWPLAGLCL